MRRTGQGVLREARRVSGSDRIEDAANDALRPIAMATLTSAMAEIQERWGTEAWRWKEEFPKGEPGRVVVTASFWSSLGDGYHDALFHITHDMDLGRARVGVEVYLEKRTLGGPRVGGTSKKATLDTDSAVGKMARATTKLFGEYVETLKET